uniref:putative alkyl/aryl-sulfatase YjcS n=1 Tax=Styela clava TaxID=7725 RepID=UPI0019393CF9|nr:putative alkyl/aryl-sulfatase YjcS [Styela clava]
MVTKETVLIASLTVALVTAVAYMAVANSSREASGNGVKFQYLTKTLAKMSDETESSKALVAFTKSEFLTPEILKVDQNIYVAIGFALGNSIMIEGDDGIIIVDTTEATTSMKKIWTEFRKITNKPLRAVIYTHFHTDHHMGTSYILEEEKKVRPNATIDIYAHELTKILMFEFSDTYDIGITRGLRQLGSIVPKIPNARTGAGLGPELLVGVDTNLIITAPTKTYSNRASYNVAGIEFELIHTPGETKDQTTVWIPKIGAVLPGDNIYKTFPNIYAIRGSPTRDAKIWYTSLDKTRALGGKYLIGSHTRPVEGKEEVYDTLLIYRDAIKYIHDQTLRLINKGYFPDQIVEKVQLPEMVRKHPNLQEHYGSVPWSIRGVFASYLGWFSGNPIDLHPMPASDHASRMARLVSYAQTRKESPGEIMLQEAQISHQISHNHYTATGKHIPSDDKWALELADAVIELNTLDKKMTDVAKTIKVSALRAIGVEQITATGRNYYLTYALEVENNLSLVRSKEALEMGIKDSSVSRVLEILCSKVRGLECQYQNYTIGLSFTDIQKDYVVSLRNSVCDVFEPPPESIVPQVQLSTKSNVYKGIAAEDLQLDKEIELGNVKIDYGTIDTYKQFLECFDPLNSV